MSSSSNDDLSSDNVRVPSDFSELMISFITEVLRDRPTDLYDYADRYFTAAHQRLVQSGTNMITGFNTPAGLLTGSSGGRDRIHGSSGQAPTEHKTSKDDDFRKYRRASIVPESYEPEDDTDDTAFQNKVFPKSDMERNHLKYSLNKLHFFQGLNPEELLSVINAFFSIKAKAGEIIIAEGDEGKLFYVIRDGKYDASIKGKKVKTYQGSGYFGELALMYNHPRSATVTAITNGSLWAIDQKTFRRTVTNAAHNTRKLYTSFLENVPLLVELTSEEKCGVADALVLKYFNDSEMIIMQGDDANCMYFVVEGEVEIRLRQGNTTKTVKKCMAGDYFGELALLAKKTRAASAFAVGMVTVAMLDVETFERISGKCLKIIQRNAETYMAVMNEVFGDENITEGELRG